MGSSISCQHGSIGNATSSCNTYAMSDAQLSAGAIIGIVIGCLVAILLVILIIVLIWRVSTRRGLIGCDNEQPPQSHAPKARPESYRQSTPTYTSPNPPPYPGRMDNHYEN